MAGRPTCHPCIAICQSTPGGSRYLGGTRLPWTHAYGPRSNNIKFSHTVLCSRTSLHAKHLHSVPTPLSQVGVLNSGLPVAVCLTPCLQSSAANDLTSSSPACFAFLTVCLSPCLCVSVSLCLCLAVCLPACLPACLCVCLSFFLPASLPPCLSVRPSACLSVSVSVCLSVSLLHICT